MLAMSSLGLYRARQRSVVSETTFRVIAAFGLGALANAITFYLVPSVFTGRGSLALALVVAFFSILATRAIFFSIVGNDRFRRNVLVFGSGHAAASLATVYAGLGQRSFRIIGYVALPGDSEQHGNLCTPKFDNPASIKSLIRDREVDEILVAMDDRRDCFPARSLLDCRISGVRVTEATTFIEREAGRLDLNNLRPAWLIYGKGFRNGAAYRRLKRAFDIFFGSLLLVTTFPAMVLAAIAIKIEGRGSGTIFFRQERVGFNGKLFTILKFRSMVPDAETDGRAQWAAENDNRVTRVGSVLRRLRIDELPQILNILKGEMSFIGPRPERPEFVAELEEQISYYGERHCVKPGLTGWAQLCYPYGASVEDAKQKLQYDLYYVKNHSLWFDALIFLQTLEVVLWGRERPEEPPVTDTDRPRATEVRTRKIDRISDGII